MLDLSHEQILDEINLRDALAFKEDFEETDDNDDEGAGSMSEECKSEDESGKSDYYQSNVTACEYRLYLTCIATKLISQRQDEEDEEHSWVASMNRVC